MVTFASGEDVPDALSGGAFASLLDSPILLVRRDIVPTVVTSYLRANRTSVSGSAVVGGAGVVTEKVRSSLEGP